MLDNTREARSACQESMSKVEIGDCEEVVEVAKSCVLATGFPLIIPTALTVPIVPIVEVDRIYTCAEEVYL